MGLRFFINHLHCTTLVSRYISGKELGIEAVDDCNRHLIRLQKSMSFKTSKI
jgi:hypothetical protein